MSSEIEFINQKLIALRAEIEETENLLDAAANVLEEARAEEIRLARTLEAKILEDALNFPSVIYV